MKSFKQFLEDKEYTALVQHPRTKEFTVIQKTDANLKSFKEKLKAKGYIVVVAEDQIFYKIPDEVSVGDVIEDGKSQYKVSATDQKYITAYDEAGNRLLINKYRFNTIRTLKGDNKGK